MTPERWRRVENLFAAAREMPPVEVGAYLRVHCGNDQELELEILSLLQHHGSHATILAFEGPLRRSLLAGLAGPATLAAGATFGPYSIIRLIGVGGMGEVYLAKDSRLHREIALKLLSGWIDRDEQFVTRFTREALALSSLNHPNIPVVYEAGEIEGRHYIASEFVDGESLEQRIARGVGDGKRGLGWREAVSIALDVAHALEAAHHAGIIHRDIKPGNILICHDGQAKLVDFGIARIEAQAGFNPVRVDPLTATGLVIGTPGYMAPEQAAGQQLDQRSDLWSLAAVLFEMLTGHRPASGISRIRATNNIPRSLARVLERALRANPEQRYQRPSELAAALSSVQNAGVLWNHPKLSVVSVCIAALVALVALVAGVLWRQSAEAPALEVRRAIAVLPFDNMSGDPGNEYLSQGIQDELLTHLERISGLKVMSRHAAAAFSSQPSNLRAVRVALRVGTVLEGSVQRQGERVRIIVHLVDTETGADLWSDSYDREIKDLFDVERDIAKRVVVQLRAKLLPTEQLAVETIDTLNPDAHRADLLGRYYLARRDIASLQKAVGYFQNAVRLDPGYAIAYSDLSSSFFHLANNLDDPQAAPMKAEAAEAAQQAVLLAPDLAEGHAALAWVLLYFRWDLARAEREFVLAVQLAPNSARAKAGLAAMYATVGEFGRAIALMHEALALDPRSSGYANNLANFLLAQRRYEPAQYWARKALELEPSTPASHRNLAIIALMHGAIDAAEREARQETNQDLKDFSLTLVQQVRDRRMPNAALRDFIARHENDSPFYIASIYAFRGDADDAFKWLDRAFDTRDVSTMDFLLTPFFSRFQSDSRFVAFCGKLGVHPHAASGS